MYDRRLSDAEMRQAEGSLLWKYGLQWRLPASHPYAAAEPYQPTASRTDSSSPSQSPTFTPSETPSPSWSTGASISPSSSETATLTASSSSSGTPSETPTSTSTPSQTGTVVPVILGPDALPGLSVWLDLADVQGRGVWACATNWAAKGYASVTAYVPWNACPYLSPSTELNGYHPVQFDTARSMRMDIQHMNYYGRHEYTIAYLARVTGSSQRVLQADNNWLMGWHGGYGDSFHFDGWMHDGGPCCNGWALYVAQSSRSSGITLSRNGIVLGNYGVYNGPNNLGTKGARHLKRRSHCATFCGYVE